MDDDCVIPLDPSSGEGPRPRKRRRVALACGNCRERKVRCDGKKPICSQCEKREVDPKDCAYLVLSSSAKHLSEQEYIANLQQKVQQLQQVATTTRDDTRSPCSVDNDRSTTEPQETRSLHNLTEFENLVDGAQRLPSHPNRPTTRSRADRIDSIADASPSNPMPYPQSPCRSNPQLHLGTPGQAMSSDKHQGPSPISAMGATIPTEDEQATQTRGDEFYGESSLVSLVQAIAQPGRGHGFDGLSRHRPSSSNRDINSEPSGLMLHAQFSLPPRSVADQLLKVYFSSVHIFYPWTHSTSFRQAYRLIWAETPTNDTTPGQNDGPDIGLGGSKCPRHVFLSALNAMFAMGFEFSDFPPEEREATSHMFFDRMSRLLRFDILDSGSIAQVQALLLVGQYLLCTHYPTKCWNVVGLACRMAVGLGLQSSRNLEGASGLEIEIRRRVWYACVQMDMTVSMTLGRPPSLRLFEDVPLPLAVDDEHWSEAPNSGRQPLGTYSTHMFNVENIRMAKLLGSILERVYHVPSRLPAQRDSEDTDLIAVLGIDRELNALATSVPDALHWERVHTLNEQVPSVIKRQSNVLHARFLHMKTLLYRPSFTGYCASVYSRSQTDKQTLESHAEDDLTEPLKAQCAVSCVKRTCELVKSIEKAHLTRATGAWWYSLFYVLTSAIILIIADCTPPLKRLLVDGMLETAWRSCLDILDILGKGHALAARYRQSLELLHQRSVLSFQTSDSGTRGGRTGTRSAGVGNNVLGSSDEQQVSQPPGEATGTTAPEGLPRGDEPHMSQPYQDAAGAEWQYSAANHFHGSEFDFSALLGEWGGDMDSLMMPPLDAAGMDGHGYPVLGLL